MPPPIMTHWFEVGLTALSLVISVLTTIHVVLHKRDTRAAIGWIGLIWLSPFLGASLYLLFGINRIQRRAKLLKLKRPSYEWGASPQTPEIDAESPRDASERAGHLRPLARLIGEVTGRPLLAGNTIEPLIDGDETYPAMIRAIDEARRSVSFATYIFYLDRAGRPLIEALRRAVERGVQVRVLIDDVGSRYSWRSAARRLRRRSVPVATFIPTLQPGGFRYANLRNHRKILVVDGRVGFTGGINILEDYLRSARPRRPKRDLHFRVEGPVVEDLQRMFAIDWAFSTGENLQGDEWFPRLSPVGPTLARGIPDGPDEDAEKLHLSLLGALACARSRVVVLTPYFLPDGPLSSALGVASLRGVEVDIFVPQRNNQPLVGWAMMAGLEPLLVNGCRVWLTRGPFDHAKLMIVDDLWVLLGSANWDARSLVLNFELDLECYDPALAARMAPLIEQRREVADRLTLEALRLRPWPLRLRDGLARLMSPYL